MKTTFWATVLITALAGFSQENFATWSSYKDISINTAPSGANVVNAVTNFPVLVRLTSVNADVFSQAAASGADIRFAASNGITSLPYQKERWDATGMVAEFWVLVPRIEGNATTTFRMYWGKSGAADSSKGSAAFDTANGFQAVWHMNSGGTGNENDATVNGYTATASPTAPTSASGAIGTARNFNGSSAYLVALNTVSSKLSFPQGGPYTLSAWVNSTTNGQKVIVGKSDYQYSLQLNSGQNFEGCDFQDANGWYCVASAPPTTGAWTHAVLVVNALAESLYVNGALVNAAPALGTSTNARTATYNTFIGALIAGTAPGLAPTGTANGTKSRYWAGSIDEVELSSVARSADWIQLSYATQLATQTAVTLGTTVTLTAPGAPTGVTGVAGNAQVTVSWTAPSSNGGSAITGYTVTATPDTSKHCSATSSLTCTITGLTYNTSYTFTVTATNLIGTSAASAASAAVPLGSSPAGVPTTPLNVSDTAGNAQAVVAWQPPSSSGTSSITGYTVTSNPDGKTCTTTGALTCIVIGLTNGTSYTFTVVATTTAGNSAASAPSPAVTPVSVPGAPTSITAVAGNASATISWLPPSSNGGSVITLYTATAVPDTTKHCTTTGALSCTISGLTNGMSYTFTVTAKNAIGTGAAVTPSSPVTPVTIPDAPTGVMGVAATGQVTVSWIAPASTGGSTITNYTATAVEDTTKHCSTTGTLNCVVTGLSGGTAYTFTVKAKTAVGTSAPSAPSTSVTTGIRGVSGKYGFGIHNAGSLWVFHFPNGMSGARISVMDVWGRMVWTQNVGAEIHEVTWNGKSFAGNSVVGIHLVRIEASSGGTSKTLSESKIMLMP